MGAFTGKESALTRARNKRATTAIPVPEIQQYGVFNPGYSGYLAASAADRGPGSSSAERFGNVAALKMNADAEQMAYANMLKRAQDLQIDAQKRDIRAEMQGDVGSRYLEGIKEGVGGYEKVETDPETGETSLSYDPTLTSLGSAYNLNMKRAETLDKFATGFGTMTEKTGIRPTKESMSRQLADVTGQPMDLTEALTPADEIKARTEETPEEKLARETKIAEINADAKGGAKTDWVFNEAGDQMGLKWTGDPEAVLKGMQRLRDQGIDPYTGGRLSGTSAPPKASPNADAQGGGASATPAAAIPPGDLTDYRDPGYDAMENRLERKYNLPPGLMKRIRVHGERTNANKVSPSGARTVYQFIPGTRQRFMEKFNIDPWSSPQNAAESAAIHLADSIKRGKDPVLEYNAGPNPVRQRSKEARDYVARVNSPEAFASVKARPTADDIGIARAKALPHVADATRGEDGIITVTLKNGRTLRYSKGKRVG